MTLRQKVVVEGLPFIWSTNLSDDGLREFYELFGERISELCPSGEDRGAQKLIGSWSYFRFRDGVCLWSASGSEHSVVFWTGQEWELRNARRAEIDELREEQAIEQGLLKVEDRHLAEKTDTAIKAGQFEVAAAHIKARMALRINSKGLPGLPYEWSNRPTDLWWILTEFPSSRFGIEFIREHDAIPWAFESFAHWFFAHCSLPDEEQVEQTWRIYEEAMKLFPDNANLVKAACLFWRRLRRYDLAMKLCSEAIKRGLEDGTKSGFEGRMKRLQKESSQNQTQRPIMNWFEAVKAEVETFSGANDFPEAEIQARGLAAVDALHELFMRLVDELKIQDDWPKEKRRFQFWPMQNIEHSAKMQIDVTMGVEPVDGWFIEAPIVCEDHIRHMKDDYWAHIIKLASLGKARVVFDPPNEWESSPGIKRLTQHEGSLAFSIARNFILLALTPDLDGSVGSIEVTLPLDSDKAAVTQFFREGLEALYRSNYLLHRSDYLERKRKSH